MFSNTNISPFLQHCSLSSPVSHLPLDVKQASQQWIQCAFQFSSFRSFKYVFLSCFGPLHEKAILLDWQYNYWLQLLLILSFLFCFIVLILQGEESPIIILSLVRNCENENLGFIKDINRGNVALSRAKVRGTGSSLDARLFCSKQNVLSYMLTCILFVHLSWIICVF